MRLKSIEMTGFKSFADRTFVEFGDGITAIVGPNGSGKSNISDAVKWVMGEQSAKSLRGGNMQDVIFSGTEKRKPLGFAEVTLVVDNSDRALKIDYDEVSVTRRVFRSGEGEYFINKTAVRLKDIHELFMDTGVGRDGYSIISQGKIAEILSSKPEDRRQMFEEASGITKYRYRKEEAERKLFRTNDNITRVNDIITELENQIGPLKSQSEKAKKYLLIRDQLRVLDVNVSLYNIERHKGILKDITENYDTIVNQATDIENKIKDIENKISSAFEGINTKDDELNIKRADLETLNNVKAEYQSDIAILKNRIENNQDSIKRIETEIAELKNNAKNIDNKGSDDTEKYYTKYEQLKEEIEKIESELEQTEQRLSEENKNLENVNSLLIEKMNDISELRYKITGNNTLKTTLAERQILVDKDYGKANEEYKQLKENYDKAKENAVYLKLKSEKNQKELNSGKEKGSSLNEEKQRILKDINDKQNLLVQQKSRLKLLTDLEESFDNYSFSVKKIMSAYKENSIKNTVIYGTVAQLIDVSKEYTVAIEVALGGAAQNIVTKTQQDAKNAIAYLKANKLGRATFLPVDVCDGKTIDQKPLEKEKGFLGIAEKLVKYDKMYGGIMRQLLGRIVVVDNIDNAVELANKYKNTYRIVTLEGDLIAPGGSMTGGSRQSGGGIFSRATERADLEKIIPQNEKQLQSLQDELNQLEKDITEVTDSNESILKEQKDLDQQLISAESDLKHIEEMLKKGENAKASIEVELKQLQMQLDDVKNIDETGADTIAKYNEEVEVLKVKSSAIKDNIASVTTSKETLSEKLISVKLDFSEVKKDIERINEINRLSNERITENQLAIVRKQENIEEIKDSIDGLYEDIEFKNNQIADIEADITNMRKTISEKEADRKKQQDLVLNLQEEQKKLHENQLTVQQEQVRLENRKEKSETELENIVNRLWDEYELSLITAAELKTDIGPITEAQKQISSFKGQIKALGNINVDSIEEYKTVSERYEFLTSQRDDLEKAKADLESVISEMLVIMRQQFDTKFAEISGHFSNIFVELFGGGKGSIKLTDPNNVLESGIEINVNPPGKSIKSTMQLSGGEQALVSIALLFAILKVRPSPFCILDEIEAALDDANVYRFAEFLNKNIGKTQYIVVTHRRGTMESANILYGVTMQEKGVTKLISINIDQVVNAN